MADQPIVLELQAMASSGNCSVVALLRKALIVAAKLKVYDFRVWIEAELNGYKGDKAEVPK